MVPAVAQQWRHAPRGCHEVTGGEKLKLCLQSFSAAPIASARLSKKVAAAMAPAVAQQWRHAPRGCHEVTGGKNISVLKAEPLERISYAEMKCISIAFEPLCRLDPFVSTGRIMDLHSEIQAENEEIEIEANASSPVHCYAFS